MIVGQAEIAAYCDREYTLDLQRIHEAFESWIKNATWHDWEETDYVEFCTANGGQLELEHYPVYKITEIAAKTTGMKIRNTSTDSRNAYVSVDSGSLDLAVIGGDNVMTASEAFATYTTLALLIAQINAEGKGWDAVVYDTDYNDYPSSALMEINNFFCGASRGVAPSYRNLQMLDTPYSGYDVDEETGIVTRSSWASGRRQVVAKYSAYHTVPEDIIGAVLDGVRFLVTTHEDDTQGLKNFRSGDLSVTFDDILPGHVLEAVRLHSKVM